MPRYVLALSMIVCAALPTMDGLLPPTISSRQQKLNDSYAKGGHGFPSVHDAKETPWARLWRLRLSRGA